MSQTANNTDVVWYLRRHGPTPRPALPVDEYRRTRDSPRPAAFVLKRLRGAGVARSRNETVYYMPEQHTPKAVLEAYLDANIDWLQDKKKKAVSAAIGAHGQPFREAWHELKDGYGFPTRGAQDSKNTGVADRDCPFCGDDDIKSFASHIPECPGR